MIVATLARKPLKGSVIDNVVRHETGALAVGACRIGTDPVVIQGGGGDAWDGSGNKVGLPMGRIGEERIGRFPANLVLVHLAGCRPEGGGWGCAGGCPVAEIDAAVGPMSGPGNRGGFVRRNSNDNRFLKLGKEESEGVYRVEKTGVMSRFFTQVRKGP